MKVFSEWFFRTDCSNGSIICFICFIFSCFLYASILLGTRLGLDLHRTLWLPRRHMGVLRMFGSSGVLSAICMFEVRKTDFEHVNLVVKIMPSCELQENRRKKNLSKRRLCKKHFYCIMKYKKVCFVNVNGNELMKRQLLPNNHIYN